MAFTLRSTTLSVLALLFSMLSRAQDERANVVGTYFPKERGGKECLKINADSTFARFLPCMAAEPDITGTWDVRMGRNYEVVALESEELRKQGCGPDESPCQLLFGKQLGRRYLIWGKYYYWEQKEKE